MDFFLDMNIERGWLGVAIAIHVLSLVWWIGGLAFLTTVEFPALQDLPDESGRAAHFRRVETDSRFQVRIALVLSGISGVVLLWGLNAWDWLGKVSFWWLDAMIAYWLVFALLLFVIEPTGVLERLMSNNREVSAIGRLYLHRLHMVLLVVGLFIVAAAAACSRGFA